VLLQSFSPDPHSKKASTRLNWHPRRYKWTRPFRWKTESGFCACAIMFRFHSTSFLSIYANITLRKMSMVILCTILWGTSIQILIFSPSPPGNCPIHVSTQRKTLHSISHTISSLKGSWSWRKAQTYRIRNKCRSTVWIKLHLTHTVYYLRNRDQQDSLFFSLNLFP